jgi:inner membrane protein
MSPVTHLLVGWVVANTANLNRRERAAVTLAGAAADLDGLGVIAEIFTRGSDHSLPWFSDYHHVLGHNLGFGLLVAGTSALVATRRWKTAGLALLAFHLHLLGDVVGARGPDGYQWPIPYLLPFSNAWQWTWEGQWALNAWPNLLLTVAALAITFVLARKRGYSPLEMVSLSLDGVFIETLRRRFPIPSPHGD